MQINITATRLLEWLALRFNLVPVPLLHTQLMPLLSQAVLEAHQINLFDQLAAAPQTALTLSQQTHTQPAALVQVLALLCAGGYLRQKGEFYRLTAMARKFCVSTSPHSLHHQQQFNRACQPRWQAHLGQYLATGHGLESHQTFTPTEWHLYQRGMNSLPAVLVAQMVAPIPLPKNARTLLDIGGAHGQYAQAFANRVPGLQATVLDLPEALASTPNHADTPQVAYLGHNALTYHYPNQAYDVIFISNLLHHLGLEAATDLCARASHALRPGGLFIIQEFVKPAEPQSSFTSAALDLYFSLTSGAGCYTQPELVQFIAAAGCKQARTRSVWQMPGLVQVWGTRG